MKQSKAFQKKNKNKDPSPHPKKKPRDRPTCRTKRHNMHLMLAGRCRARFTVDPHHAFGSIRSLLREGSSLMLC